MKTISSGLNTHLQQDTTTVAQCWKIKRVDGEIFTFTTADIPLSIDIGDGDGVLVYSPDDSFSRSAVSNSDQLNTDHLEVTGIIDFPTLVESDFRNGVMDGALVYIFLVNYNSLADGILKMRKGRLGHAKLGSKGIYQAELMGMMQKYSRRRASVYSPSCEHDLGDKGDNSFDEVGCHVPIMPPIVQRTTAYALGDFVRASSGYLINLTVTNPGAETGTTGWTNEVGTLDATDIQVTAHSGSAYFAGGNAQAETKAYQDITIPGAQESAVDAGNRDIRLSWYQNGIVSSPDTGEMTLRFYDVSSTQIGSEIVAGLIHIDSGWVGREIITSVPKLTRTVRVSFHGVRITGSDVEAFFDDVLLDLINTDLIAENFDNRMYEVTTAGITGETQPAFNTTVGNTTTDGSVVFTARESWSRFAQVVAVDSGNPRKVFTVTQLTPNSGSGIAGKEFFPHDSMNMGIATFESGDNKGVSREIRDFIADDGVTIQQVIELYLNVSYDIQVGDKIRIHRGCSFDRPTCRDIFNNMIDFGGYPDLPGEGIFATPDVAI